MEILIKFPTRSRPTQFKECLDTWISLLSGKHNVNFLVNLDDDDPTLQTALDLFSAGTSHKYTSNGANVEFMIVHARCKHEACNIGMHGRRFDIAIVAADDMWPQVKDYDDIIATDMDKYYPGLDGSLYYWDGFRPDSMPTLCIIGYNLYRRFNYFFSPAYVSLYGDTENGEVHKMLHKFTEVPEWSRASGKCLVKHLHPIFTGAQWDELMQRNETYYGVDGELFNKRRAKNFDIKDPILSILICSIESRHQLLVDLLAGLYAQVFDLPNPDDVEILYNIDNLEKDVGTKRNELMDIARGKYLCYIDDDDKITADYVAKLVAAAEKDVDVICFLQLTMLDLKHPRISRFAIEYKQDTDLSDVFQIREPNHLCPTRATIARQYRFPAKSMSEDSERWHLMTKDGVLKTGYTIEEPLYIYDFRTDRTETQKPRSKSYKKPIPQTLTSIPNPVRKPILPHQRPIQRPIQRRTVQKSAAAAPLIPGRSRHFENGILKRQ
jgi:hypothetical protein